MRITFTLLIVGCLAISCGCGQSVAEEEVTAVADEKQNGSKTGGSPTSIDETPADAHEIDFCENYLKILMEHNQTELEQAEMVGQRALKANNLDEAAAQMQLCSQLNAQSLAELRKLSSQHNLSYPFDFLIHDVELALQRRGEACNTIARCVRERDSGESYQNATRLRQDADKWISIAGGVLPVAQRVLKDGGNFGSDTVENPTKNADSTFLEQYVLAYFDGSTEFEKSRIEIRIKGLAEARDDYILLRRRMGSAQSAAREILELEAARLERLKFSVDAPISDVAVLICHDLSFCQEEVVEANKVLLESISFERRGAVTDEQIAQIEAAQYELQELSSERERLKLSLAVLRGILNRGGKLSEKGKVTGDQLSRQDPKPPGRPSLSEMLQTERFQRFMVALTDQVDDEVASSKVYDFKRLRELSRELSSNPNRILTHRDYPGDAITVADLKKNSLKFSFHLAAQYAPDYLGFGSDNSETPSEYSKRMTPICSMQKVNLRLNSTGNAQLQSEASAVAFEAFRSIRWDIDRGAYLMPQDRYNYLSFLASNSELDEPLNERKSSKASRQSSSEFSDLGSRFTAKPKVTRPLLPDNWRLKEVTQNQLLHLKDVMTIVEDSKQQGILILF